MHGHYKNFNLQADQSQLMYLLAFKWKCSVMSRCRHP